MIFCILSLICFFVVRWDDDVVFKNQARGEIKATKRFINDTIRNDFHKKFLQKYMKWNMSLENAPRVVKYCESTHA